MVDRFMVRSIGRLVLVAVGFALVALLVGALLRPDLSPQPTPYTPTQIAEAARLRDVRFDPSSTPSLHVDSQIVPRGQAPVLAGLVESGHLSSVSERMPERPAVMRGRHGVGTYGGTWLRIANSEEDVSIVTWRLAGTTLVRWSPLGYPIEPHVAQSVESSPDHRIWTVQLRKGLRWSDGHPYTADDIMYWWHAEANNPAITTEAPAWMIHNGKLGTIERVDEFAVRFVFEDPHAFFLEAIASKLELTSTPSHYLRQFHPDPTLGDAEVIARTQSRYRLPSARSVYGYMKAWTNPEHPRLWPWIYRTFRSNAPHVFVRNPYYFVVDEAGNQLPYLDRVQFDVMDVRMLALTAANGGVTMQGRHIRFNDYVELMSRRDVAKTHVYHWYPSVRSVFVLNPNLNRRVDPDQPQTAHKARLLSDKRFRQALSLALNRRQIIEADYSGIGEPSQVEPGPESPFHHPPLAKAFVEHDPARANAMLDELGLNQRDSEGYRTFPDGTRMSFYINYTAFTGMGPMQFIVDDWASVGVRAVMRERTRPLFYVERDAMDFDFAVWTGESDFMPAVEPRYFVPRNTEAFYAVGWARWFEEGGYFGRNTSRRGGVIPVPEDHPMRAAMGHYLRAMVSADPVQQKRELAAMMQIAAENLWTISIATPPPVPIIVDRRLRNVPERAIWGSIYSTPANAGIETYWLEGVETDSRVQATLRNALLNPTPRPAQDGSDSGSTLSRIIRVAVLGVVVLTLGLVALRHPFVGRRLLIMIPTLGVISVIVFTVIQLPPGDFLTTRLMILQESRDEAAMRTIDDLKRMFRYEDPPWQQYLRWMGLPWFLSFDSADAGLLQGNLGRSMETSQPINNIVGDRMLLTVVMSLGTILFTWALAIPIGIYSAVRQYSIGDYILTLVGFVGMCIPAFLLALVLMAVSGVSGLFSPYYAAQPFWSWGKVIDLLKHLWIPVVVLGVGGTAGMIRVMRANLLDELKKPYVITALAKGVRPTRLLLKYPVRLALNPFVSGIGGLFPQIVSGGAIVSMVLALPTVGPLLLSALFTEDMYLAGSMLMLLSLLGVLGTLVSDLLLLWLDPRIRMDGGSR
jgi:ABC-type dipeptide/oligopeptide/nickel transport system permease component/ABC-type transport system substrate-binding protein